MMLAPRVPDYWDDACRHLTRRDRVMKKLIPRFGESRLQSAGDAFTTLARSIVSQQLSLKAAQSSWARLTTMVDGNHDVLQPLEVLRHEALELRSAGLSTRKVDYLLDLARHFDEGAVHVAQWRE
ncbi:MAG TPA: DNA-3-methyladenine glycosylase 2 family protein, partial [Burkholderiaceae bacterium]|nr:DNA-3-methyladenine glycosylase 2 family protein [Burkholderiaceae bacterium]